MTQFTVDDMVKISQSLSKPNDNMRSILKALDLKAADFGLDDPVVLPHFLCQLSHESMGFKYDREIWGPTAAQKRYEGRADLGNIFPGDGEKFSGKGPIQLTGRRNVTAFYNWCIDQFGVNHVPDFVNNPELINTDPWEGLSSVWFWDRADLNHFAQSNNLEAITRNINGGTNGLSDRYAYYTRCALVMLGRSPTDIRGFQTAAGFTGRDVDGIAGRDTRSALHQALRTLPKFTFGEAKLVPEVQNPTLALVEEAKAVMKRMAEIIAELEKTQ